MSSIKSRAAKGASNSTEEGSTSHLSLAHDNNKKEINIVKYSETRLLGLVHNRPLNNVVRISLVPMHSTFNFTFTTAKMSTLMRTIQTSLRSTTILVAFLAAFSLFSSTQSIAQDFKMGLAISPNTAWMVSTDYDHETLGAKVNFGFEFMADVLFSENYALGLGVNVFNTGGDVRYLVVDPEDDDYLMNVDRTYSLQYVELPLTFKMRTNEIGYTTVFGRFGLGVGMNIKAEADEARYRSYREITNGEWSTYDVGGSPISDRIPIDSDVKLFRASMIIGGGIERTLSGETALVVGLNYNASFTNTHKDVELINVDSSQSPVVISNEVSTGEMKGHDSFISLSVGILF
jgi:hypothetical protein